VLLRLAQNMTCRRKTFSLKLNLVPGLIEGGECVLFGMTACLSQTGRLEMPKSYSSHPLFSQVIFLCHCLALHQGTVHTQDLLTDSGKSEFEAARLEFVISFDTCNMLMRLPEILFLRLQPVTMH
jgi:hypothetical protein